VLGDLEGDAVGDAPDRLLELGVGEGDDLAAVVADHVVVMVLGAGAMGLVAGDALADLEAQNEVEALELVEDPVDAGARHRAAVLAQPRLDLVGRERARLRPEQLEHARSRAAAAEARLRELASRVLGPEVGRGGHPSHRVGRCEGRKAPLAAEPRAMRNRQLHVALGAFAEEAAWQLAAAAEDGAEVPFEVVTSGRRDAPLYCYRPLTGDFIAQRVGLLERLESYPRAVHALSACGRLEDYLVARGEPAATAGRERAVAVLRTFLTRVFEDSTTFELQPERFGRAFAELERALYDQADADTVVIAPLLGLELDSDDVVLSEDLALVAGDAFAEDAPTEALWAPGAERPHLLCVLRWEAAAGDITPVAHARIRLRRLLTALRLFDEGAVSFGPLAWTRTGAGAWQPFALGALGHRLGPAIGVVAEQEDELRAFCSLVTRRTPRAGELAWALRRFDMACDRALPAEALTDVLLALRALLEPEGAGSGRLAGRVAALCALPEDRAALASRVARTVELERGVVTGLGVDATLEPQVRELTAHLRALLRDVLCGHLDADLRSLADELIAEEVAEEQPALA
jgi:hypothetical protein